MENTSAHASEAAIYAVPMGDDDGDGDGGGATHVVATSVQNQMYFHIGAAEKVSVPVSTARRGSYNAANMNDGRTNADLKNTSAFLVFLFRFSVLFFFFFGPFTTVYHNWMW